MSERMFVLQEQIIELQRMQIERLEQSNDLLLWLIVFLAAINLAPLLINVAKALWNGTLKLF